MKISIALAAYNGAAYLSEQLESFAAQTRLPDELVVVDDRSRDGTPDVVKAFAYRAPFPVRLVMNEENLGFAQNFGKALSLCSGDLVFMSDQDDVWFESKIAKMVALAAAKPEAACFMNDAMLTDAKLATTGVTKLGQLRSAGLPETAFVMGCCTAVRRELLDILLPVPAKALSHDNWSIEVSDLLGLTCRSAEVLQFYRIHGANESDFFVNRPREIGRLSLLAERLKQLKRRLTTLDSLAREHNFYSALTERLAEKQQACARLVGSERLDEIVNAVEARRRILADRLAIRRLPLTARIGAIITFWRQGGYQDSGGMLGLLKDLVAHLPSRHRHREL